ncbi:hypothetical protein [Roseibium sp. MMSF_3544]|uniref:hypothetical protein n=1 Tax=unclassified Roseibium TaxID=2629323 RepID=UPI00273EEC9C|nr:hypothetical protein [Roseibium sp. MMSF_3544]
MDELDPYSGEFDTLASDSSIRLFGRLMWDIQLRERRERIKPYGDQVPGDPIPTRESANDFLVKQLSRGDARLARIMAFSYQNEIFDLARPAIFLVHGKGSPVEFVKEGAQGKENPFLRRMPPYTDRSGVVIQGGSFGPNIKVWLYDRADFTVRLDSDTGTFERVLLEAELGCIGSGSMGAGDGDDVPPPPRRRRRWRGSSD